MTDDKNRTYYIYEVAFDTDGRILGVRYGLSELGRRLQYGSTTTVKKLLADGHRFFTRIKEGDSWKAGAEVVDSLRTKRNQSKKDNLDELPPYTPTSEDLDNDPLSMMAKRIAQLVTGPVDSED